MKSKESVLFTGPRRVEVASGPVPQPGSNQILVKTLASAISAGTEMLVYRDQFPPDLALDGSFADGDYAQPFAYPLSYGYTTVGCVTACGKDVNPQLIGRELFAFQPHSSHFATEAENVILLPDGLAAEAALFLPNMETAVNLVQDGRPILGDRVLVIGLGIVGLLTGALLSQFPLATLIGCDRYANRRAAAEDLGLKQTITADGVSAWGDKFDLIFECSGNPNALNTAIELADYNGRIVVGSWYGQKTAPIDLGGRFHRNRLEIVSSQVSSIAPNLSGRWDKARRFESVIDQVKRCNPTRLITHRYPLSRVAEAYEMVDQQPDKSIQVILAYN